MRCKKFYELKCPTILKTKNETAIERKCTRNHECDRGESKTKEVVNQIKRSAQYSTPTGDPTDRYFDVPDEFAPFLLQDSGKDDKERILIFGDATMKNLLSLSMTWLVDGVFKLSPEIFYQIYKIHVELNGFAPPCVYVLLPNKTEKTYNRMIELLSEETNPNPGKILADFAKATLNAFSKSFPSQKSGAVIST